MSKRPRILICDPMHEAGLAILRREADIDFRPDLDSTSLPAEIAPYQALVVRPRTPVNHQVMDEGYNLRAIGCLGARLDNIDVSTARALGIAVCNSPSNNAVAIAEHTMAHMLLLAIQTATLLPDASRRLAGKTLGIIGFGAIGQQVARRALSFDMPVIVNQPRLTPELALNAGVSATDLMALLREADFVSLHIPFKAETEALIGAAELAAMRPSACLVNTGHTGLVDDAALLAALDSGQIAGAAVSEFPVASAGELAPEAQQLRQHPRVLVIPHVTTIIGNRRQEAAISVAEQLVDLLREKRPSDSLSLEVVPIAQVSPHEQIDDKRVARLMERLEKDGQLVNPPITTYWKGRYVILDGATRFTSLQRLGYPHVIVQVVDAERDDYALHTWYHAISSNRPVADLLAFLQTVDDLQFDPLPPDKIRDAFHDETALCYLLHRDGAATRIRVKAPIGRLAAMNELVAAYTSWGTVERTLLTDLARLQAQFPHLTAVAVFPQFSPETVFEVASRGDLLPAGLTRFVIPGRILRLNADLRILKRDEPLATKRAWFNQFLAEKLARSRLRYYQEPVILLDE
jgi:phosphoglycerate dehydrogenase-like enzyme